MRGNAEVTYTKVTITRSPYGDKSRTVADPVTVPGAVFAPRSSTERASMREPAVITGGTLYQIPAELEVGPDDEFTVNGLRYTVQGDPGHWVSPFSGRDYGYEVAIQRYENT